MFIFLKERLFINVLLLVGLMNFFSQLQSQTPSDEGYKLKEFDYQIYLPDAASTKQNAQYGLEKMRSSERDIPLDNSRNNTLHLANYKIIWKDPIGEDGKFIKNIPTVHLGLLGVSLPGEKLFVNAPGKISEASILHIARELYRAGCILTADGKITPEDVELISIQISENKHRELRDSLRQNKVALFSNSSHFLFILRDSQMELPSFFLQAPYCQRFSVSDESPTSTTSAGNKQAAAQTRPAKSQKSPAYQYTQKNIRLSVNSLPNASPETTLSVLKTVLKFQPNHPDDFQNIEIIRKEGRYCLSFEVRKNAAHPVLQLHENALYASQTIDINRTNGMELRLKEITLPIVIYQENPRKSDQDDPEFEEYRQKILRNIRYSILGYSEYTENKGQTITVPKIYWEKYPDHLQFELSEDLDDIVTIQPPMPADRRAAELHIPVKLLKKDYQINLIGWDKESYQEKGKKEKISYQPGDVGFQLTYKNTPIEIKNNFLNEPHVEIVASQRFRYKISISSENFTLKNDREEIELPGNFLVKQPELKLKLRQSPLKLAIMADCSADVPYIPQMLAITTHYRDDPIEATSREFETQYYNCEYPLTVSLPKSVRDVWEFVGFQKEGSDLFESSNTLPEPGKYEIRVKRKRESKDAEIQFVAEHLFRDANQNNLTLEYSVGAGCDSNYHETLTLYEQRPTFRRVSFNWPIKPEKSDTAKAHLDLPRGYYVKEQRKADNQVIVNLSLEGETKVEVDTLPTIPVIFYDLTYNPIDPDSVYQWVKQFRSQERTPFLYVSNGVSREYNTDRREIIDVMEKIYEIPPLTPQFLQELEQFKHHGENSSAYPNRQFGEFHFLISSRTVANLNYNPGKLKSRLAELGFDKEYRVVFHISGNIPERDYQNLQNSGVVIQHLQFKTPTGNESPRSGN
ncbi:MAG: hypothetical protein KDH98_08570 [Calditrichaeota bacterium]|nr:hypothetical protein [Calditrichota bacterium]